MLRKLLWLSAGLYWIGVTLICYVTTHPEKVHWGPFDASFLSYNQTLALENFVAIMFCVAVVLAWIMAADYVIMALFASVVVYGGLYGSALNLQAWVWVAGLLLPIIALMLAGADNRIGRPLRGLLQKYGVSTGGKAGSLTSV